MDIYTLDENFLRKDVIDEFTSVIWTERYSEAGDVNLIVPVSRENVNKLSEGTFLATQGTKEVMQIETALIEKNQLKVTGPSLLKFLDERPLRYSAAHEDRYYNIMGQPTYVMGSLVNAQVVASGSAYVSSSNYGLDGPRQVIRGLFVGKMDDMGSNYNSTIFAVPYGSLYAALKQIADTYSVGMSLYLETSTKEEGLLLLFRSYIGRDLTSEKTENPVRFSPAMDSLTNLKELRSIAGYKNVAYAFAPANPGGLATKSGVAYADNEAATSVGFKRRVLMVFADDLTTDKVGGSSLVLQEALNQRAKDALANNNYTKVVDGEVVPQNQYKYGKDYRLGDIVELQSLSGLASKARVTEYIRTQDATGERAYPTISVID